MLRLIRYGSFSAILAVLGVSGSSLMALQSYQRLSAETLVAELSFERLDHHRYRASLLTGDFCQSKEFLLLGDQWRIDAQFLKWKPWANVLGLDSRYRLDRLEGRYSSLTEQNQQAKLSHGLSNGSDEKAFNHLSHSLLEMLADVQYGSSTYQGISTERIFQVYKTQSGLITRLKPKELQRSEDGSLVIEINHACPQP